MLMRTDPFRELERFTQRALGTAARPAAMPMDAWRDGDEFIVEFDLPGVGPDTLDLNIENNVVTVRAERAELDTSREMLASERPRGVFSRQLMLGNNLDTGRITADYRDGVLRLVIPAAEKAKPRKITVSHSDGAKAITKDENKVITEDGDPVTKPATDREHAPA
jgi:HSP20 family protein